MLKAVPAGVDDGTMTRTDPWCSTCMCPMSAAQHESQNVWRCHLCASTFVTADQLRAITTLTEHPRSPSEQQSELRAALIGPVPSELEASPRECPWCTETMRRVRYGGDSAVLIDRCGACEGILLDEGELERVEAWAEAQRDEALIFAHAARRTNPHEPVFGAEPAEAGLVDAAVRGTMMGSHDKSDMWPVMLFYWLHDIVTAGRRQRRRSVVKEQDVTLWAKLHAARPPADADAADDRPAA